jgi:gluconolactonase
VNNYRGRHLNSPNDIIIDSKSNLWFTDPAYGWYSGWPRVKAPELPNSIYFFNSSLKALIALSNSIALVPNGLAFSADESILYVSDTNSTSGRPVQSSLASQRNIWAFDVNGTSISNARLVYETETGWPDGLRVTSNGFLIIGAMGGADVVDPRNGVLLGKINAVDDIIFNVESIPGTGTWFLTGQNYIYKVTIREKSLSFK